MSELERAAIEFVHAIEEQEVKYGHQAHEIHFFNMNLHHQYDHLRDMALATSEQSQAGGCAPPLSPQAHSHIQRQLEAQTGEEVGE